MKNYLSYGHYSTLDFRRWRTVDGCFKTSNGYVYVPACVDTETWNNICYDSFRVEHLSKICEQKLVLFYVKSFPLENEIRDGFL